MMQKQHTTPAMLRRIERPTFKERLESLFNSDLPYDGKWDVLDLTADYGAGHRRCSAALKDAIKAIRPGTTVLTLNYMEFVHPLLDQVTKSLYVNTVKVAPELYRGFYFVTKSVDPGSVWQYTLSHLGHRKLLKLLRKTEPKVVICTFPTPAGVVGELKRRGLVNVPQVTVITDNAVHTQWVSRWTDLYIVASDSVKEALHARGIDPDRVHVTGIPIDRKFAAKWDKLALRAKYGLAPDLPTVLILGSAYGMTSDVYVTAEWLARSSEPCQGVVVTGHDLRLRELCLQAVDKGRNLVKVFGFVDTMHELMALSDLVVTKAGGLTVSEALAMGLPMVIHKPIPGQEEENCKFLLQTGAAIVSKDPVTTWENVLELLRNEKKREEMRQAALKAGKPNSALEAAELITRMYLN